MLAKTYCYGLQGLDSYLVTIEVDVSRGLPMFNIVGLPDNAIKESKERVRAAIRNCGFRLKPMRITINLSPADTKKEGPSFDLAIALGILAAYEEINISFLSDYIFLGELALDGALQSINGTLPIALNMANDNFKGLVVPTYNAREASISQQTSVYPMSTLSDVIQFLVHPSEDKKYTLTRQPLSTNNIKSCLDFADVKGQLHVKRGLEIAAAGGHNVLLIGPPGSGKSMLAKRLSSILPDMTEEESIETTKIHSIIGKTFSNGLMTERPFRCPHHTTSHVAIVGGGSYPRPGEVTLSHNGVLFLDELPEFSRQVLETLRQPLEDHYVTISRASKTLKFPSKFMLICAMNPCPCGHFTDPKKNCQCSSVQIQKYMSKITGPMLDRIDLHIEVPTLPINELFNKHVAETSAIIKERTANARDIQYQRLSSQNIFANAYMNHRQIKEICVLNESSKELLKKAIDHLGLSARAHDRILKLSRTIADLANSETINEEHISEAIQYRCLDRGWWG